MRDLLRGVWAELDAFPGIVPKPTRTPVARAYPRVRAPVQW